MLTVAVQEYDIADVRPVFGERTARAAARTLLRPMRSAPRCGHDPKDQAREKDELMKLTTTTQVSVDGVMQGNGAASDEDRTGGFERGG
jgi:hypothetical protein